MEKCYQKRDEISVSSSAIYGLFRRSKSIYKLSLFLLCFVVFCLFAYLYQVETEFLRMITSQIIVINNVVIWGLFH